MTTRAFPLQMAGILFPVERALVGTFFENEFFPSSSYNFNSIVLSCPTPDRTQGHHSGSQGKGIGSSQNAYLEFTIKLNGCLKRIRVEESHSVIFLLAAEEGGEHREKRQVRSMCEVVGVMEKHSIV